MCICLALGVYANHQGRTGIYDIYMYVQHCPTIHPSRAHPGLSPDCDVSKILILLSLFKHPRFTCAQPTRIHRGGLNVHAPHNRHWHQPLAPHTHTRTRTNKTTGAGMRSQRRFAARKKCLAMTTPPLTLPGRGWGDSHTFSTAHFGTCNATTHSSSSSSASSTATRGTACMSSSSCGSAGACAGSGGGGGGGSGMRGGRRSVRRFELPDGFSSAEEETWGSEGEVRRGAFFFGAYERFRGGILSSLLGRVWALGALIRLPTCSFYAVVECGGRRCRWLYCQSLCAPKKCFRHRGSTAATQRAPLV